MKSPLVMCLPMIALAIACSRDDGSSGSDTTDNGATTSTSNTGGSTATTAATAATDGTDGSDGGSPGECFLWEQDCIDPLLKCMPWSLEDDRIPDETKCCPVVDNPKTLGDGCEVFDYNGSCLDDCEKGALCVLDDEENLTGVCHRLCDPKDPQCGANQTCKAFFELFETVPEVPVCMHQCDPLIQDCSIPTWSCLPDSSTAAGQSGFICQPPPPHTPYGLFDSCALANDCQKGLVCITGGNVPDCGGFFCCTQYCSLSEPDPCPTLHPDMQCVDWMSPDPQWQNVGVCALPP